jgi:glycosyltransferase involved in cell wall biosynthesis
VRTLLRAWQNLGNRRLLVVGDGPLDDELRATARTKGLAAEFLGHRPRSEVLDLTRRAMFLIVPSEWFEGFPMVVLEALACGTPIIASELGSLDEIVTDGVTGAKFPPGDAEGLVRAVRRLGDDPDELARMRVAARATFDREYGSERNLSQLMAIYRDAISGCAA